VVGTDLRELVVCALADPRGESLVLLGALRLADAAVRDVADQDVLEAEGAIAGDRRPFLWDNEIAREQRVDDGSHVDVRRESVERTWPEDATDKRGALQDPLLVDGEPVDARRDQRLHRVGDAPD